MSKLIRKQEGFTLVELMIVVLILGILVAIAVPVYLSATDNAKTNTCKSNLRTIDSAQSTYAASNDNGNYATDITGLVDGDALKTYPTCPSASGSYVATDQASTAVPFTASCPNHKDHKL